jgi:hypothetical protein
MCLNVFNTQDLKRNNTFGRNQYILFISKAINVKSLTEENAADLQSVSPLTFMTTVEENIDPVRNMSVYPCTIQFFLTNTSCHMLHVSFITSLKTSLCIISHAKKNMTELQSKIVLTGRHRLVVTHKGQSAFWVPHHCQGQLQTTQTVTILIRALE